MECRDALVLVKALALATHHLEEALLIRLITMVKMETVFGFMERLVIPYQGEFHPTPQ